MQHRYGLMYFQDFEFAGVGVSRVSGGHNLVNNFYQRTNSFEIVMYTVLVTLSINQTNYFIVRLKVDQRAGQLILPHIGITKTEKIELKHKTDEQISPVNGLEL